MCGRCNKENDGELVDGGGCCSGSTSGQRCLCLPYNDGYMIAAQIISVVAFLISWVWWVTFIIGTAALALLQIVWCCRQTKAGLLASAAVSALATLMCVLCGIYILVVWKSAKWCWVFYLESDDDDDDYYGNNYDYCKEGAWAAVAFVSGVLWFAVTGCILYFVKSGRQAKWDEKLCNNNNNNNGEGATAITATATAIAITALEMGTVQHQQEETASSAIGGDSAVISMATSSSTPPTTGEALPPAAAVTTTTADSSYVPPQISTKVDDV